jgi:ribonucleoside-diphosphate reductase alpha chain
MTRRSTTVPAEVLERRDNLPDDLPAADLSDNARIVLARRYLKKDERGRPIEEPEQMFWRVAHVIAEEDAKYGASDGAVEALGREFYRLMTQRLFEPNSPTLMNAGRPLGQLSACFVLPVEDSISNGKNDRGLSRTRTWVETTSLLLCGVS